MNEKEKAEERINHYFNLSKELFDGANISWVHCAKKLAEAEADEIIQNIKDDIDEDSAEPLIRFQEKVKDEIKNYRTIRIAYKL